MYIVQLTPFQQSMAKSIPENSFTHASSSFFEKCEYHLPKNKNKKAKGTQKNAPAQPATTPERINNHFSAKIDKFYG